MWESSQTRAWTRVACIGRQILNHCATREALCHYFEPLGWWTRGNICYQIRLQSNLVADISLGHTTLGVSLSSMNINCLPSVGQAVCQVLWWYFLQWFSNHPVKQILPSTFYGCENWGLEELSGSKPRTAPLVSISQDLNPAFWHRFHCPLNYSLVAAPGWWLLWVLIYSMNICWDTVLPLSATWSVLENTLQLRPRHRREAGGDWEGGMTVNGYGVSC